jgi:hypothetical protein
MKNLNITELATPLLITIHNSLADKEVKGFKSKEAGVTAVTELLEAHTKGKEKKAKLQLAISCFPLTILAALASAIPFAKELGVKVLPAHRRVLKVLFDATQGEKTLTLTKLEKACGLKAGNAKFADVMKLLYSLNLITWDDEDNIGLLDTSINFVKTNQAEFDSETGFDELQSEPVKVKKSSSGTGSSNRLPKAAILKPAVDSNPCNPASTRYAHFEPVFAAGKKGMTVEAYTAAGGNSFNLLHGIRMGYIKLEAPSPLPEGFVLPVVELYPAKEKKEKPAPADEKA